MRAHGYQAHLTPTQDKGCSVSTISGPEYANVLSSRKGPMTTISQTEKISNTYTISPRTLARGSRTPKHTHTRTLGANQKVTDGILRIRSLQPHGHGVGRHADVAEDGMDRLTLTDPRLTRGGKRHVMGTVPNLTRV